jgi:DegV family protein with EDD domain
MLRIITDSTCEAPASTMQNARITVVPLSVVFGKEALRDEVDITRAEFWERLPHANPLPTTAQVTPAEFFAPFKKFTDAGDEVLAITISTKFSGTYESAITAAAELPDRPITVVDSRSISVGLGLFVQKALALSEAGVSREAIATRLIAMREEVLVVFALDTLEYLQRGGRIGKAQAFLGTVLRFKPLLSVVDGEVAPAGRVRTKKAAVDAMIELLSDKVSVSGANVRLGITHSSTDEEAAQLGETLSRQFQTSNVFVTRLGPVIGVHTGPGTLGAAVFLDS